MLRWETLLSFLSFVSKTTVLVLFYSSVCVWGGGDDIIIQLSSFVPNINVRLLDKLHRRKYDILTFVIFKLHIWKENVAYVIILNSRGPLFWMNWIFKTTVNSLHIINIKSTCNCTYWQGVKTIHWMSKQSLLKPHCSLLHTRRKCFVFNLLNVFNTITSDL
jgi:hypothetical protein